MTRRDHTEAGGRNGAFLTTHWTQILGARTENEERRRQILDELVRRYWKPVYCYLRRRGLDNESAKDLTQGFFHEVVLGRSLVQRAESSKGRFRTFLLTALDRYVTSAHRAQSAQKRSPDAGMVSIDAVGGDNLPEPSASATPAEAFHHAWAAALVDSVMRELELECAASGRDTYWKVFHARVIAPILDGIQPVPIPELCRLYSIKDDATASNMIVTLKRRFQSILRRRVRQFVESEDDVDGEIQELIGILSTKGAG